MNTVQSLLQNNCPPLHYCLTFYCFAHCLYLKPRTAQVFNHLDLTSHLRTDLDIPQVLDFLTEVDA